VIVEFFENPPDGSEFQATGYVVAHSLFLLYNVLNVAFLLIVQWFALGRLQRSNVLKLTFLGCFLQQFSCISSVTRWNIGDPVGIFGIFSASFGIAAKVPLDIAYIYVYFNKGYRKALLKGSVFFIILGISLLVATLVNWETDHFEYLTMDTVASTIWHIVAVLKCRTAFMNGDISIRESIITADSMSKLLLVVPLLDVFSLLFHILGAPDFFGVASAGIPFTSGVLLFVYLGRMDFMGEYRSLP